MSRRMLILSGIALGLSLVFFLTSRERPVQNGAHRDPVAHEQSPTAGPVDPPRLERQPVAAAEPHAHNMPESDGIYRMVSGTGEFVSWTSRTPASKRTEIVHIDPGLLTEDPVFQVGDQIEVVLHDGVSLVSTVSKVQTWSNGTVAVNGIFDNNPHSRLMISYTDGRASMLIQDHATGTSYRIKYARDFGQYVALEMDLETTDVRECAVCQGCDHAVASEPRDPGGIAPQEQLEDASAPDVVTLDLLVVYTPAARTYEGSVSDMQNSISLAVQLANDTHGNSDTRVLLNLAHSAEVAYTEDNPETSASPGKYLDNVSEIDGVIDNVQTLRDTYAADFVVFVVDTEETGGLANRPSTYTQDDSVYSIVRVKQLDDSYTMVHEIAHNMGLGHSAGQAQQPFTGGIYPYAAGWQWADATSSASIGFCTVMTYQNYDGNSGNGSEYRRVAHFSNPDVLYNGNSTGSSGAADGARVIRNGRFDYSAFRGPKAIPSSAVTAFPDTLDFEEYFGIWYQPDTDDLEWQRNSGGTPSPSTGPTAPNAGSFYAYIEMSGFTPGDEAQLTTILDLSGLVDAQVAFAYHMYGNTMGSLTLEASIDGGSNWSTLWTRSGDQGNFWFTETVNLPDTYDGQTVNLRFRGVRGTSWRSDIALDDISVSASIAPATFATFIAANYPALSDKTPGGDPDLDGVINFLEYAFGMLLDTADANAGPSTTYDDVSDELSISFVRAQESVRYVVQSTDDLDFSGSPTEEWDSDLSPPDLVPVGNTQTVDVSMPGGGKLFLRVGATE